MALDPKFNDVVVNDGGSSPIYNPFDGNILDSFNDAINESVEHANDVYGYKGGYDAVNVADGSTTQIGGSSGSILDEILPYQNNINDANVYSKLSGKSVEDQLLWLINNDPDNATGWMESLLGLRAERENVQSARDWEKMMEDSKYQRAYADLEAAGINPILAYQYVNGSASNVGTASYSGGYGSSLKETKINSKTKAILGIVASLISAMAVVGKFMA